MPSHPERSRTGRGSATGYDQDHRHHPPYDYDYGEHAQGANGNGNDNDNDNHNAYDDSQSTPAFHGITNQYSNSNGTNLTHNWHYPTQQYNYEYNNFNSLATATTQDYSWRWPHVSNSNSNSASQAPSHNHVMGADVRLPPPPLPLPVPVPPPLPPPPLPADGNDRVLDVNQCHPISSQNGASSLKRSGDASNGNEDIDININASEALQHRKRKRRRVKDSSERGLSIEQHQQASSEVQTGEQGGQCLFEPIDDDADADDMDISDSDMDVSVSDEDEDARRGEVIHVPGTTRTCTEDQVDAQSAPIAKQSDEMTETLELASKPKSKKKVFICGTCDAHHARPLTLTALKKHLCLSHLGVDEKQIHSKSCLNCHKQIQTSGLWDHVIGVHLDAKWCIKKPSPETSAVVERFYDQDVWEVSTEGLPIKSVKKYICPKCDPRLTIPLSLRDLRKHLCVTHFGFDLKKQIHPHSCVSCDKKVNKIGGLWDHFISAHTDFSFKVGSCRLKESHKNDADADADAGVKASKESEAKSEALQVAAPAAPLLIPPNSVKSDATRIVEGISIKGLPINNTKKYRYICPKCDPHLTVPLSLLDLQKHLCVSHLGFDLKKQEHPNSCVSCDRKPSGKSNDGLWQHFISAHTDFSFKARSCRLKKPYQNDAGVETSKQHSSKSEALEATPPPPLKSAAQPVPLASSESGGIVEEEKKPEALEPASKPKFKKKMYRCPKCDSHDDLPLDLQELHKHLCVSHLEFDINKQRLRHICVKCDKRFFGSTLWVHFIAAHTDYNLKPKSCLWKPLDVDANIESDAKPGVLEPMSETKSNILEPEANRAPPLPTSAISSALPVSEMEKTLLSPSLPASKTSLLSNPPAPKPSKNKAPLLPPPGIHFSSASSLPSKKRVPLLPPTGMSFINSPPMPSENQTTHFPPQGIYLASPSLKLSEKRVPLLLPTGMSFINLPPINPRKRMKPALSPEPPPKPEVKKKLATPPAPFLPAPTTMLKMTTKQPEFEKKDVSSALPATNSRSAPAKMSKSCKVLHLNSIGSKRASNLQDSSDFSAESVVEIPNMSSLEAGKRAGVEEDNPSATNTHGDQDSKATIANIGSSEKILRDKRERLKLALRKEKLEKLKAQLALAQLRKEEVSKKVKLQQISSLRRDEISFKENTLQKEINVKEDALVLEDGFEKTEKQEGPKEVLSDVSAFRMKSLLITNIGSYGSKEEIRYRATSNPDSEDVWQISGKQNEGTSVPPTKNIMKLRLNLELAKNRLKLAELKKAKTKILGEQQSKTIAEIDDQKTKEIEEDCASQEPPSSKVETVHDLLKRQEELRESISASKEAQKELKNEQSISSLREMIEKQKVLLQYHGSQLRSCTDSMRSCMTGLEQEKKDREKSDAKLQDSLQRKAVTEKMVRAVTRKIMKLRRRRERDSLKGNG